MKALHDFKCERCGEIFERLIEHNRGWCYCSCGYVATKTFERWGPKGGQLPKFPGGPWHGLPEVDGHPPDVRTKRQLREALKRKAKDDFTESYAAYDDGYGGY